MKRKYFFSLLIFCFGSIISFAQPSHITQNELELFAGKWKGSLTYLDYTSQKPYSMPADVIISYLPGSKMLLFAHSYPKEPAANNVDTVMISMDGSMIGKAKIISKILLSDGTLQIITESAGFDGNDNQPATIRHTYSVGKNLYQKKKEVRFEGKSEWIERNRSGYTRE